MWCLESMTAFTISIFQFVLLCYWLLPKILQIFPCSCMHLNASNMIRGVFSTAWKVSKYGVVSGPYFTPFELYLFVFSPNAGKYGPEKTPYCVTFHAVQRCIQKCITIFCKNSRQLKVWGQWKVGIHNKYRIDKYSPPWWNPPWRGEEADLTKKFETVHQQKKLLGPILLRSIRTNRSF